MSKLTVKDIEVGGKRVFVRVDFNVPLTPEGAVLDDTKIRAALPTIKYLLEKGGRVILASHLGRPQGHIVEELRMDPVAARLSQLLGQEVQKVDAVVGEAVEKAVGNLSPGEVLLLENVRFEPGERKNDPGFAQALARLGDVAVSDAFGTAHRAHASNSGVSRFLPVVAGFLMEKEILYLTKSRQDPPSPLVAILGGKKVADKIGVIRYFIKHADSLLLGGAMANTFLKARGLTVGSSFYEEDKVAVAGEILQAASGPGLAEIFLPIDLAVTEELRAQGSFKIVGAAEIPAGWSAVDIGPKTVEMFQKVIRGARLVLWNGPLGAYEYPPFNLGTENVARAVAASGAESVVGGGDLVAALDGLGLSSQMTHVSTGGGAILEFWEGKELPGLAAINNQKS
ncbi:MAG: phosphoglycerate kinase [Firmicutes bacterium]|nr:phosphoglycerate kinase [Bacillota bacterium]